MTARIFEGILNRPRTTIYLASLLAFASLFFLLETGVDNSLEIWLMRDTPAFKDYHLFTEAFGSEEFVLAAIEGQGILGPEGLEVLREATNRTALVRGVKSALSPSTVLAALGMLDERGKKALLATPTYRGLLASDDGAVAGLYLAVDPSVATRSKIVSDIRGALDFLKEKGYRYSLGGPPVLHSELDRMSSRDPCVLFPVILIVTILILGFLFRSFAGILVPLACLFVTVVVSMAAVNLFGRQLNMITVTFPTLLWVLSISQAVHLLTAYGRHSSGGLVGRAAAAAAVAEIRYPCFMMSVTTATAFLSLLFSHAEPVQELGAYTAGGILLGYFVNILLGPALLLVMGMERGLKIHGAKPKARGSRTFVAWIDRRKKLILGGGILLVLASLWSAASIEVETNALRYLRKDNPLLAEFDFIQEKLVGLTSLEIDLEEGRGEPLAQSLEKIESFSRRVVERYPEVRVLSVSDLLKAALFNVKARMEPLDELTLEELRRMGKEEYRDADPKACAAVLPILRSLTDVSAYITEDASRLRISLFSPVFETSEFKRFRQEVTGIAREVFEDAARVTGLIPLMVTLQQYLTWSQVRCMGAALLIVAVFMVLAAKSLRLGLLSMAPNVFPVILNFGLMGLAGVRLDVGTVMIASMAVGIAVDNTIHMIYAYRKVRGEGAERNLALERTVQWKARPICYTTLVTCCGFSILALSEFLPMAWFGGLIAFTIFWAMAGDLLMLPALLGMQKKGA